MTHSTMPTGTRTPIRPLLAGEFQSVLTIRAQVREDEVASFTRTALRDIRSYIEQHHLQVEGPPFSICREVSADQVDVEAGWPTAGAPGSGPIHSGVLPAARLRLRDHLRRPEMRTTAITSRAAAAR